MGWLLRGLIVASLAALALLAVATRPVDPAVVIAAPTPSREPTSTPRPTATPEVVISRVTRVTPGAIPTRTPTSGDQPTVSIVDFAYLPQDLRIRIGQTVTWVNEGRELHDVTGDDWYSGPIDPTRLSRHTFGFAGRFTYRCSVHLDMRGAIAVLSP